MDVSIPIDKQVDQIHLNKVHASKVTKMIIAR